MLNVSQSRGCSPVDNARNSGTCRSSLTQYMWFPYGKLIAYGDQTPSRLVVKSSEDKSVPTPWRRASS